MMFTSRAETRAMSIVALLPRPDPLTGSRLGGDASVDASQPPKELLPDGGNPAAAPAPVPERVLARDALRLIRRIDPGRAARSPSVEGARPDETECVRRQLDPI